MAGDSQSSRDCCPVRSFRVLIRKDLSRFLVLLWDGHSLSLSEPHSLDLIGTSSCRYHLGGNRMHSGYRKLSSVMTTSELLNSYSCHCSVSNTMRFGPTLMNSVQRLQEWPAVVNRPVYATATASWMQYACSADDSACRT